MGIHKRSFPNEADGVNWWTVVRLQAFISEMLGCQQASPTEALLALGPMLLSQCNPATMTWEEKRRFLNTYTSRILGEPPASSPPSSDGGMAA